MSTALSVSDKKLPVEQRVANLRSLMMKHEKQITAAAMGAVSGSRLIQLACNSIAKNLDLLECTPASIFSALNQAASYGWLIDGVLGHAYLVPFNNTKRNCKEAVLIPGYKGLRDLIHRAGKVQVAIESVHQGDTYEYLGQFQLPKHVRSNHPERRYQPVTHAYCVGRFENSFLTCFSWTVEEVIAHRDRYSQNWRRIKDKPGAKDSPWHVNNPSFRVMCMKTVLLDAIHRGEFPLSVDQQQMALRASEESEFQSSVFDADGVELISHQDIEGTVVEAAVGSATEQSEQVEQVDNWQPSETEKARISVMEALPECKSQAQVNKVLVQWQGVLAAQDDKAWLVAVCDERAQEIRAASKQK